MKITGKSILTDALLAAIGEGATAAQIQTALAIGAGREAMRAVDGALQREKKRGSIEFGADRRWHVVRR